MPSCPRRPPISDLVACRNALTSVKRSVPTVLNSSSMPMMKPASPTRLTMNAFLPASPADFRSGGVQERIDIREAKRAHSAQQQQHADDEARVAHAIDDECLLARVARRFPIWWRAGTH